MAAVTSAPVVNPPYHPPKIEMARSRSPAGFTAVNGRETAAHVDGNSLGSGDTIVVSSERYPESRPTNRPLSRQRSPSPKPQEQPHDQRPATDAPVQMNRAPSPQPSTSSLKRKRSISISEDRESSASSVTSSGRSSDSSPPAADLRTRSPTRRDTNDSANYRRSGSPRSQYPEVNGHVEKLYIPENEHRNDSQRESHRQRIEPARSESQVDSADSRSVEMLQHETQGQELSQHASWTTDRMDVDPNDPEQGQYGAYSSARSNQDSTQIKEKRKRIFSNRTKTGCMTCRRRKKKCDEGHPACKSNVNLFYASEEMADRRFTGNNCIKGGFSCAGYSARNSWQKAANAKPPVPLEAKKDIDYMVYPNGHASPPQRRDSMRPDARLGPVVIDDSEHPQMYHNVSPPSVTARVPPAPYPTWPQNRPAPYPEPPRDLPRLHGVAQAEPPRPSIPPISEMTRIPEHRYPVMEANPPPWHGASGAPPYPRLPPNPLDQNNQQSKVPIAMKHDDQSRESVSYHPDIGDCEKDRMLRGAVFRFTDKILSDERASCSRKLSRFNRLDEDYAMEEEERASQRYQQIKSIIIPAEKHQHGPPQLFRCGKIGPGIQIDSPFRCHYGYNLHLGEDVYIGECCNINDAMPITIGDKTWIGSNVMIFSAMAHTSLQERHGANSLWKARPIRIGRRCHIGPGVTIYPGVELADGVYVEAGAVVKESFHTDSGSIGKRPDFMQEAS
ncbi:MAG: hypothetical protein Q9227_000758 [Pyrenula ochraceoflavens]